ncbi:MAG TPA: hypothetical protein VIK53_05020 [Verrucomicrobiae bacterium]
MKTATIELPDPVFDKLVDEAERKQQSVPRYISDLLTGHTQSGGADHAPGLRAEPVLPLISSPRPGSVNLTNARLAEMEAEEDAQRYGRIAGR